MTYPKPITRHIVRRRSVTRRRRDESERPSASERVREPAVTTHRPRDVHLDRARPRPECTRARPTDRPARSTRALGASVVVSASPPPRARKTSVHLDDDDDRRAPSHIHRTCGIYNSIIQLHAKRIHFQDPHSKQYPNKRSRFDLCFRIMTRRCVPPLCGCAHSSRVPSSCCLYIHGQKTIFSMETDAIYHSNHGRSIEVARDDGRTTPDATTRRATTVHSHAHAHQAHDVHRSSLRAKDHRRRRRARREEGGRQEVRPRARYPYRDPIERWIDRTTPRRDARARGASRDVDGCARFIIILRVCACRIRRGDGETPRRDRIGGDPATRSIAIVRGARGDECDDAPTREARTSSARRGVGTRETDEINCVCSRDAAPSSPRRLRSPPRRLPFSSPVRRTPTVSA